MTDKQQFILSFKRHASSMLNAILAMILGENLRLYAILSAVQTVRDSCFKQKEQKKKRLQG
jgi:hypothetical protein